MKKKNIFFNCAFAVLFLSAGFLATNAHGQKVDCKQNPATHPKQCTATIKLFESAKELLLGQRYVWIGSAFNGHFGEQISDTAIYWVNQFANESDPKYKGKFLEGTLLTEVTSWIKTRMATDNVDGSIGRQMCYLALNNAFRDVYGFVDKSDDYKQYESQIYSLKCAYYSTIRSDQQKKLNTLIKRGGKLVSQRPPMISRAYREAMGRDATDADLKYWEPRPEDFRDIVFAARNYLYSPLGATDLKETVKRALTKLNVKDVSDGAVGATSELFKKNKLIYAEMINQ